MELKAPWVLYKLIQFWRSCCSEYGIFANSLRTAFTMQIVDNRSSFCLYWHILFDLRTVSCIPIWLSKYFKTIVAVYFDYFFFCGIIMCYTMMTRAFWWLIKEAYRYAFGNAVYYLREQLSYPERHQKTGSRKSVITARKAISALCLIFGRCTG